MQFWLFNDALMYGSALTGGLYQFNRVLWLNKTTISKSTSQPNAFEIRNPSQCCCSSPPPCR